MQKYNVIWIISTSAERGDKQMPLSCSNVFLLCLMKKCDVSFFTSCLCSAILVPRCCQVFHIGYITVVTSYFIKATTLVFLWNLVLKGDLCNVILFEDPLDSFCCTLHKYVKMTVHLEHSLSSCFFFWCTSFYVVICCTLDGPVLVTTGIQH